MKLGLIPLSSDKEKRELELNFLKEVIDFLKKYDIEAEEFDLNKNFDYNVFLVVTGGSEKNFLNYYNKIKEPHLFIANKYNNSLPATIEINAYLNGKGKIFLWDKKDEKKEFVRTLNALNLKKEIKDKKFGLLGDPSYWLIASTPDLNLVKERFGITVEKYPIENFIEDYKKINFDEEIIEEKLVSLKKGLIKIVDIDDQEIKKAIKVYLLLEKLIKEKNWDLISMECFRIINPLNTTGCLALSLLNDLGVISGCEGDIPSTLTMYLLKKLTGKTPFMGNISGILREGEKNIDIILSHCTVPLSIVNNYLLTTHFETKKGVGIKGYFTKNIGTLVRIGGENLDKIFFSRCKIVENLNDENMCRTQIVLNVKDGKDYFLKKPLGNHHIFVIGDYGEELETVAKIFDFKII